MKTEASPAIRSAPLVVNCFYFGAAHGQCHHPVNATARCGVSACAMLAADLRHDLLAVVPSAKTDGTAFASVHLGYFAAACAAASSASVESRTL